MLIKWTRACNLEWKGIDSALYRSPQEWKGIDSAQFYNKIKVISLWGGQLLYLRFWECSNRLWPIVLRKGRSCWTTETQGKFFWSVSFLRSTCPQRSFNWSSGFPRFLFLSGAYATFPAASFSTPGRLWRDDTVALAKFAAKEIVAKEPDCVADT